MCYTALLYIDILNVILLLYSVLYFYCYTHLCIASHTQCYTEAYNVYSVWITEEYTRYTLLYNNAFYTVQVKQHVGRDTASLTTRLLTFTYKVAPVSSMSLK